jgi:uncharacterized protein (DUF4415 family)
LIDDEGEVRELTREDFKHFTPFSELPAEEQRFLLSIKDATIRPDPVKKPVSVALSTDVVARFEATGADWQDRMDNALRQWLEEHPLEVEHAKAS